MQRENLKSRLGFIMVSAACAIGLGNIWRFPYIVGMNGGACFIIFYLLCLLLLGLPLILMEFAMGRASRKGLVGAYMELKNKRYNLPWHYPGWIFSSGSVLLMMFYTVVTGWLLYYTVSFVSGGIMTNYSSDIAQQANAVSSFFHNSISNVPLVTGFTAICYVPQKLDHLHQYQS